MAVMNMPVIVDWTRRPISESCSQKATRLSDPVNVHKLHAHKFVRGDVHHNLLCCPGIGLHDVPEDNGQTDKDPRDAPWRANSISIRSGT